MFRNIEMPVHLRESCDDFVWDTAVQVVQMVANAPFAWEERSPEEDDAHQLIVDTCEEILVTWEHCWQDAPNLAAIRQWVMSDMLPAIEAAATIVLDQVRRDFA